MATGPLAPVVRYLRKVTNPNPDGDRTDAELLSRFALHRDEEAFTTLVRRHGPMVLAVCKRVVRDGHMAEDAFQATFLVLARKAGSLAQPELLGHWLHGVAYRTALKAKIEAAKRRVHERQAVRAREVDPSEEFDWRDLRGVLDEEVNRLPERYRVPVVLCYLQGQTNAEAASRLGCSRGTIATLLARARDKLRRRLTQRGVGLSVGVTLAALTQTVRGGAVPLALEHSIVKAATLLAAGQTQAVGALAAQAVALAKGVSKGMLMEKLKIPAALLMMTAFVGAGVGVAAYRVRAQEGETATFDTESKPRPPDKAEPPRKHVTAPVDPPKDEKAQYRTPNFVVTAPTAEIARRIGGAAEHNRKALARLWLDKELPDWAEACPVLVTVTHKTVGGFSEFAFSEGKVSRIGMRLEGSLDRIFADLLPHEMTHNILVEGRSRPMPRWTDEGAAILSESVVSRDREEQAMERLLRTGHPQRLRELLPSLDFPKEIMAFYAQSFSLTDFLVSSGGRKKFLAFVAQGERDGWDKAANSAYGYKSVEMLERAWLDQARKRLADKRRDEPARSRQEIQSAKEGRQRGVPTKDAPPPRLQIKGRLPDSPAPAQVLAVLNDESSLIVCRKILYYQPVTSYRTEKTKDGQTRAIPITTYRKMDSDQAALYDIDTVRVYNTKGQAVEPKELRKRLKEEVVALVSADGRPVDPLHLRLYKEDTLVFVIPLPVAPPPVAPPPPKVGTPAVAPPAVAPPPANSPVVPSSVPPEDRNFTEQYYRRAWDVDVPASPPVAPVPTPRPPVEDPE